MVTMIPASYEERISEGEKQVFDALRQLEGRPSWIAIHSLKQARSLRKHQSETDFVVIAPGKGILLIEVKGATKVAIDGNKFEMYVGDEKFTTDPLDQLSRGTANIRQYLKTQGLPGYRLPISRLVWFNRLSEDGLDESKRDKGMELYSWELAWADDLLDVEKIVTQNLDAYVLEHLDLDERKYNPNLLTPEMAVEIADSLRVKINNEASIESEALHRSILVHQATTDQVKLLDHVSSNQHVFFNGGAGSGKTQILVEAAVRFAEQGKSVLVTAWNEMMARDLRSRLAPLANVYVSAVSAIFSEILDVSDPRVEDKNEWYDRELPRLALEKLHADSSFEKFDALCIDEFQDLASKPVVLEALFATLVDRDARVVLVGDDRQQIMNLGPRVNSLDAARAFLPNIASFDLKSNCRQSPGLSRKVHDYLGLDHSDLKHLVSEDAEATFVIKHVEKGDQLKELARLLKELIKKYPTQEIRIVSPLSTKQSSLFQLFHATEIHSNEVKKMMPLLKNLDGVGEIGWRSVSKYKGMEADVVVIIDLDDETAGKLEADGKTLLDQLYVGMTRARFALYLITSSEASELLAK